MGAATLPPPDSPATGENRAPWRECVDTIEVSDAHLLAGPLFRRSFGHSVPAMPRHYVMFYRPPVDQVRESGQPVVVGYTHQLAFENVYLAGGMCVDAGAYRRFPRWLFDDVKREGGLATIIMRDSFATLGDCPAVFGHVGEKRARLADLRAGFVDTGRLHLMVHWRRPLPREEQERLVERIAGIGPF